ncbi:MAG: hypothetical protein JSR44_10090 [Spirochaetes bacterium]|nr:hypothetical protein [Spirochaetota bacterium]
MFKYFIVALGILSTAGMSEIAAYSSAGTWVEDGETFANFPVALSFVNSKQYTLEVMQGGGYSLNISGDYMQTDDGIQIVSLSIVDVNNAEEQAAKLKALLEGNVCKESQELQHVKYSKALVCERNGERMVLWAKDIAAPVDIKMVWQGVPVVTTGVSDGLTTDCVRLRESPSLRSKSIPFIAFFEGPTVACIPKDTKIIVYARTPTKQKVQGRTNYWYLIDAGTNRYQWVFGEFVKILK